MNQVKWQSHQKLEYLHIEKNDRPIVTITLSIKGGNYLDPKSKSGLEREGQDPESRASENCALPLLKF